MANIDDIHTKEKIEYNKRDYEKEINALFEKSIADRDKAFTRYIDAKDRDKAYTHYIAAIRQICLHTSKKLGEIISDDNFESMMNGGFTRLIDTWIYRDVTKELYRRWQSIEREMYDVMDRDSS